MKELRPKFFGEKAPWNTGCWRGYIAEWTIIDDELYLTKIYSCDYPDKKTADLRNIFKDEYIDGRVKASWFTGDILLPKGKQLLYDHSGYSAYYESEILLDFKEGKLSSQQNFNYPKTHESIYSKHPDSLTNFIYSNINWKIIPPLADKKVTVIIGLTSGDSSKPHDVRILRPAPKELLNEEAVRVFNLLPDWNVYYTRGKAIKKLYGVPIVFDEEKRRKYSR